MAGGPLDITCWIYAIFSVGRQSEFFSLGLSDLFASSIYLHIFGASLESPQ